jgi:exopolysaccharide production protein ExoZ
MFFYAVFACVMGVTRNRRALVLGAVMVLFVLSGPAVQPGGVVGAFYTNPILLEFAAGVGLAHLWALQPDRNRSDIALGAVVLSAGIALLIWHARTAGFAQLMPERAVIFGIPAVFCVAGAMLLERGGFAVKSPLVMVLGGASYALYLFHGLVLQCLDGVIRFVGVPVGTAQSAVGTAILAFVLCHLIAIILHVRVERPLTALLRGGMARVRMA